MTEIVIFSVFLGLTLSAHWIGEKLDHFFHGKVPAHHVAVVTVAAVTHPAVREGLYGYAIHFFVYSGAVIGTH